MTEPFQGLAAKFGATLGAPAYPSVMVPHPISTKSEEYLRELGSRVASDVIARLTG